MRTESADYKASRAGWVTKPSIFIRADFVRRAGDLTSYPFTRDFAEYPVLNATTTKLICVKEVRGQTQEANPVAGRSTVGTLEIDLGDMGREILRQVADPAQPLRLPVRGRPTIRHSSYIRTTPCARTLYASTWTQSGLSSFTAAEINNDDTETTVAFDADAATGGAFLKLDLGAGNDKAFIGVAVYSKHSGIMAGSVSITPYRGALGLSGESPKIGGGSTSIMPSTGTLTLGTSDVVPVNHNAYWWIQYSDDDATWTTISKGADGQGFGTGGRRVDAVNFPYAGTHRYWRLLKQNGAQAGPDYYEVQFSTEQLGRNVILQVPDSSGYPSTGHVTVADEDIFYTAKDDALGVFGDTTYHVVTRAARDTLIGDHDAAALVRNGEQLRRGSRLTLFLGYQPMDEDDFMRYSKLEVQSYSNAKDNGLTWTFRCSDIQRFVKRKIFELATETNPVVLGPANPITLLLQVWMSTGVGNNGPYDVLPRENGAAVPMALVDIAGWEAIRGMEGISSAVFRFRETEPQESKDWGETQILRPLMILPDVNQAGQLTGRVVASPMFSHGGLATGKHRAA